MPTKKTEVEIAAYQKAWRKANREKMSAYHKIYRAENREKRSAYNKAYRAENFEKIAEKQKVYLAAFPNEHLAIHHKHRAKKAGARIGDGKVILAWIKSWKTETPVACHYCKSVSPGTDMQIDHVIPLSAGGDHDLSNLVVCCSFCNSSKHNKLPEVWLVKKQHVA